MMNVKVFTSSVIVAMGLAFGATSAQASTVTLFANSVGGQNQGVTAMGTSLTTKAGGIDFTVTATTDANYTVGDHIVTWCVDVLAGLTRPLEFTIGDFSGAVKTNLTTLVNERYDSLASNSDLSAFQLAIWEIVYDSANGFDLSAGNFTANWVNSAVTDAGAWLAALGTVGAPEKYKVTQLIDATGKYQNQMDISAVPVPGAALLFGTALLGAGFASRKKAAAKAQA